VERKLKKNVVVIGKVTENERCVWLRLVSCNVYLIYLLRP
jgi:hypothetical protein